jgi:hypothetical protein
MKLFNLSNGSFSFKTKFRGVTFLNIIGSGETKRGCGGRRTERFGANG